MHLCYDHVAVTEFQSNYSIRFKMALLMQTVVFIVVFTLVCAGQPGDKNWYISVNTHKLYKLVEEGNFKYYDPRGTEEVLKQILTAHRISEEFVDMDASLKRLKSKIVHMYRQFKKQSHKGGNSKKMLLEQWTGEFYRLHIGDLKRKYDFELEEQRKRRKIAEEKVRIKSHQIHELKKKHRALKIFASRLISKKYLGGTQKRKKTSYSKSWIRHQKKVLSDNMKDTVCYMKQFGVEPVSLVAKDEYGNTVQMEFLKPRAKQEMSIDEVLYRKDRHLISDFAYKEFTHLSPDLPSLKRVKKRAVELNSNFHIHYLSNSQGVYETLEGKLNWLISQLMVKGRIAREELTSKSHQSQGIW
ncbi:uncharacterized protein [Apostichopus japonicus]|uniref:uncharacterized protein n=1 Tax=Stichopus japonicus TaxID=307972 RepID=UPI003AB35E32